MEVSLDGSGGSGERRGHPPGEGMQGGDARRPPDPQALASRGSPVSVQKEAPSFQTQRCHQCFLVSSTPLSVRLLALALGLPARCPSDPELVLPLLLPLPSSSSLPCSASSPCSALLRVCPRPCRPSPQLRATLDSLRPALCLLLFWLIRDPCELPVQGTDLRPQCLGFCGLQWCGRWLPPHLLLL